MDNNTMDPGKEYETFKEDWYWPETEDEFDAIQDVFDNIN